MLLTILLIFLPPFFLFKGLKHWVYALHIAVLCIASWIKFPSLSYPLFHAYYPYYIGIGHILSINTLTFIAYGWDKKQAIKSGWRIPEKTLHALSLIGGTMGAWAGSKFFRHKTIKKQFRQMFWLITGLQIAAVILLIWLR